MTVRMSTDPGVRILRYTQTVTQPIGRYLELKELEDDFLSTLTLKELIDFNGKINHFWKKRPLIADLDDDDNLSRLINFYIKSGRIYKDEKGKDKVQSPNSLEILSNCSNFYIPCRVKKNNKIDLEYKQISPTIPLDEIDELNMPLEDKFSVQIKLSELDCLDDKKGNALTLKDVHGGFNKLIRYYDSKKKISRNDLRRATKKYKHCDVKKHFKDKNDALKRILLTPDRYYIPSKKNIYPLTNEIELRSKFFLLIQRLH
ncbi:MAG: hypothetical protein J0647_06385, partial [Campylobacteraceae bacterium]|nr:hypothetical protein [Campylobacteraceae bacterium]